MESTFKIGSRKIKFTISNFGMRRIYVDDCLIDKKWKLLPYGVQEVQVDGKPMRIEIPSRDTGNNSAYYDGTLIVEELLPEMVAIANDTTKKLNTFNSIIRPASIVLIIIALAFVAYNNVAK